jgi:hypothetical protein
MFFGFAVTSAMSQTWTWTEPALINNGQFAEFQAYPAFEVLNGCDDITLNNCTPVSFDTPAIGTTNTDTTFTDPAVDSVVAPLGLKYGIDDYTVGLWNGSTYVGLDKQPNLPISVPSGTFTHIAAGANGSLYVIFEETTSGNQYVVVGTPPFIWEVVDVRFTPRSLNLGSNGRWITCKIRDLPDLPTDYESWDEVIGGLCIVAVNDIVLDTPICRAVDGPSNTKNSSKLMVKFNRKALADAIQAQIDDPLLDVDDYSAKITLAFSDGNALNFYGEDTLKTKPRKEPRGPKKPK